LSETMPCGGGHTASMPHHVAATQEVYGVQWDGSAPKQHTRGWRQERRSDKRYTRQVVAARKRRAQGSVKRMGGRGGLV
jgi:hypothetical protein